MHHLMTMDTPRAQVPVRVKFLARNDPRDWRRYFPAEDGRWGDCLFIFERDARDYDWLVVYDDVPPAPGEERGFPRERLACPRGRTLLVTTEPASIKAYGRGFAAQFGHVLTSQPAWALPHPHRHHQQSANHWFYGRGGGRWLSREEMVRGPAPEAKSAGISIVHSKKRMRHTQHARRFDFIERLCTLLPELEVFGRGFRPMNDKAEALAPFRYHVAVENHIGRHHITEKLTDGFLGRCLTFYAGAPNVADYFPVDSFVAIDMRDPEGAAATIRHAVREDAWSRCLPAIEEARRRVLEEQNVFAITARIISGSMASAPGATAGQGSDLLGRHAWRKAHPLGALGHALEKTYVRVRSMVAKSGR